MTTKRGKERKKKDDGADDGEFSLDEGDPALSLSSSSHALRRTLCVCRRNTTGVLDDGNLEVLRNILGDSSIHLKTVVQMSTGS